MDKNADPLVLKRLKFGLLILVLLGGILRMNDLFSVAHFCYF